MPSIEERIKELERTIQPDAFMTLEQMKLYARMLFEERGSCAAWTYNEENPMPPLTEEDWKWYREISKAIEGGQQQEEKGKQNG